MYLTACAVCGCELSTDTPRPAVRRCPECAREHDRLQTKRLRRAQARARQTEHDYTKKEHHQ